MQHTSVDTESIHGFLWPPDPKALHRHAAPPVPGAQLDPDIASKLLPPILTLFMRRTFASIITNVNGRQVRIVDDLPHGKWCYVELQASAGEYIDVHEQAAGKG